MIVSFRFSFAIGRFHHRSGMFGSYYATRERADEKGLEDVTDPCLGFRKSGASIPGHVLA